MSGLPVSIGDLARLWDAHTAEMHAAAVMLCQLHLAYADRAAVAEQEAEVDALEAEVTYLARALDGRVMAL